MFHFQGTNNKSLLRFAVVTVVGMVVALSNPFTIDAKEKISKRAMKDMIAGAKTAADHKAIANYYYEEAAKARAKADEHNEMAAWYRKGREGSNTIPYVPATVGHCERLVTNYKSAADDLTALAKEHEAMAKQAK